jgi:hypothetical protein
VNYGEPPGSPVSSPIKLTVNDITEILLKVALSTKHRIHRFDKRNENQQIENIH